MKRFISIAAILAASAAVALAQPPSGTVKKRTQAVQVVAKTTTTYDTIAIAPTTVAANDSLLNARFDQLGEKIEKLEKQSNETASRVRKMANQGNIGSTGNFMIKALQNTIPILPFVVGVLIAIFWFRYSYKRRVMRQELIYKYVDRGEQVPEWLARAEASTGAPTATPNGTQNPSQANAKMFLVLSIILASVALIFIIALANSYGWVEMFSRLAACGAFGFAAAFCFHQYLKRTE